MRRLAGPVAVVAAVLAFSPPVPAAAPTGFGPPCNKPKPPLSPLQEEIATARQYRRGSGLRSDREWILRVLRSPRAVGRYTHGTPLLRSELAYMRKLERTGTAADRVQDHVRAQGRLLSGGVLVDGDYPRPPIITVRLTRDRAFHEPRIRAAFPQLALRFADAPVAEPFERFADVNAEAVRDRVSADLDELNELGVFVQSLGVAEYGVNQVEIEVITARTDAQAFFEERYGPAVLVEVVARELSHLVCTPVDSFRPSHTGRTLFVGWVTNSVYRLRRIEVREDARTVRIGVVHRAPTGSVTQAAVGEGRRIRLKAPLGGRRVIDAATGRRLRLLTAR